MKEQLEICTHDAKRQIKEITSKVEGQVIQQVLKCSSGVLGLKFLGFVKSLISEISSFSQCRLPEQNRKCVIKQITLIFNMNFICSLGAFDMYIKFTLKKIFSRLCLNFTATVHESTHRYAPNL